MSETSWFILKQGQVHGPMSLTDIETEFSKDDSALVWAKGLSEWIDKKSWAGKRNLFANHVSIAPREWKVRTYDFESKMVLKDLIDYLKPHADLTDFDLFDESKQSWKNVYYFPEITDALGISRRASPRVPIVGELNVTHVGSGHTFKVVTISQGGIGLVTEGNHFFKLKNQYSGTLKTLNLPCEIEFEAETIYGSNDGYVGLRFTKISDEHVDTLVAYIKKFEF